MSRFTKFIDYFESWVYAHKKNVVREVTFKKYICYINYVRQRFGKVKLTEMNRLILQEMGTDYGQSHTKSTTTSLLYAVVASLRDAYDDGLIERVPPAPHRLAIKGNGNERKGTKFLNQNELRELVNVLNLNNEINWDYFILILIKTGMRFSEALALMPEDFNFEKRTVNINKSFDYKITQNFALTKTSYSIREIVLDWHFVHVFMPVLSKLPAGEMIFKSLFNEKNERVYNSTINDYLTRLCKKANIPRITLHGLRHTHASTLISDGVSVASVAKRLGHSGTEITQKVYIHLQAELEARDTSAMMKSLSGIC